MKLLKFNRFKKKFNLKTKNIPQENADELKPIESDNGENELQNETKSRQKKGKQKRKFSKAFPSEEASTENARTKKKFKKSKKKHKGNIEPSIEDTIQNSAEIKDENTPEKKKKKSVPAGNGTSQNEAAVQNSGNDENIPKKKKKQKSAPFKVENDVLHENDEKMKKNFLDANESFKKRLSLPGEIKDSRDSRTIFVGNLPINFNKKKLTKLFSKCGEIEKLWTRGVRPDNEKINKKLAFAKKLFHKDQLSLVAYILYKTAGEAQVALTLNGELFDDHHIRVSISNDKNFDKNKGIFLGNLPFNVTDDEIWTFFKDCGEIVSVRIIRETKTGLGKGFGYVNFKSTDGVELALQLNETELHGREIRITRLFSDGKRKKLMKRKELSKINENKKGFKKTGSNDKKSNIKFKKNKGSKTDLKRKRLAEKLLAKPKKKDTPSS